MKYKKVKKITGIEFETPIKEISKQILRSMKEEKPKDIVIVKGRQVGISLLSATISATVAALSKDKKTIVHLFPTLNTSCQFSKDKYEKVIVNAKPSKTLSRNLHRDPEKPFKSVLEDEIASGPDTNSVWYKKFKNDSFVKISGAACDAVHGFNVDVLFLDEAQCMKDHVLDFRSNTWGGVQVYIVTPNDPEHFSKSLWDCSTQNEFRFTCYHCLTEFVIDSSNWDTALAAPDSVRCPSCSEHNNKKSLIDGGRWIEKNCNAKLTGFRVPQTIVSTISNESFFDRDNHSRTIGKNKSFINESFAEWVDF